jgi:hypothetical protein
MTVDTDGDLRLYADPPCGGFLMAGAILTPAPPPTSPLNPTRTAIMAVLFFLTPVGDVPYI